MTEFLQLATTLIIILISAKLAGYLSTRIGQPSVFGELLVGVLLGPSLIDITHIRIITDTHLDAVIHELGEIGVLLLMFMAGLELHIKDLTRNTKVAALAGVLGVIIPVGLGTLFGQLLKMPFDQALFLGLTLGATSVSISAQVLVELNMLKSKIGLGLLGAAIFDDILVILFLSAAVAILSGGGNLGSILLVFGKMIAFLLLAVAFGLWLLPKIVQRTSRLPISQGITTLALVILLGYGLAAELIGGMAAITGTFVAGLMFGRTPEKNSIENSLHSLSYAFFVPIFFISIGLGVNLKNLQIDTLWILLGVTAIAVFGKVVGAGGGALIARLSPRESLQVGIGMISRGEVGLIIAKIGDNLGYITEEMFAIIVGMILVTTLITPPLLRWSFRSSSKQIELGIPPAHQKEESV